MQYYSDTVRHYPEVTDMGYTHNHVTAALVEDLAHQVAPCELIMFWSQHKTYLRNPQRILSDETDSALNFCIPIIRRVVVDVLRFVKEEFGASIQMVQRPTVTDGTWRILHHDKKQKTVSVSAPLDEHALRKVNRFAYRKAIQYQLSERKALALAYRLMTHLSAL